MRRFILGANGMLGHVMVRVVSRVYADVIPLTAEQTGDLAIKGNIDGFCDTLQPDDVVINCVGMLRQRLGKQPTPDEIYRTMMLNCYLPHRLSESCQLIHISSDCVFSGRSANGMYLEHNLPDEPDLYGRSKAMGEPLGQAMVIRTSIIGPELQRKLSLYEWFMAQNTRCSGYTNHYWNGVTTRTLSECVAGFLKNGTYKAKGLRHIYGETVSKHQLLCMLNELRPHPIEVVPTRAPVVITRTLCTLHQDFLLSLGIPSLREQLRGINQ